MRLAVAASNQIMRYKTSLECVGNGGTQVDDLYYCLFSLQVQLYMRSGWISPNYWNEANFKPVMILAADENIWNRPGVEGAT